MSDQTTALSPRHERFVLEFLRDGNATQAYIRAGYSPRGAQPSASRLLRDVRIAAAVAAGRQRLALTLEVSVERLAQEYAKIAFANVSDYVSTDAAGGLSIDLDRASEAQRAGILELKLSSHRDPEKRQITLKLGKLQALAALTKNVGLLAKKPAPTPMAQDRERAEERRAAEDRYWRIQARLRETEAALARAEYEVLAAKRVSTPSPRAGGEKVPSASEADEGLHRATTEAVVVEAPQSSSSALREPSASRPIALPQVPAPPDTGPALRTIAWNTARRPPPGPTWHDIMRQAGGRFPGR